jgi:hypothetical protein
MPSIHQRSANHLQNINHQMSSPTKQCCQSPNLYQNLQQTQGLDQYQAQYQNSSNNNNNNNNIGINGHHIQHYNSNNVINNNNKLGHQMQPQPYYSHQNYSNPSYPIQQPITQQQQYYQQPVQQMPTQFQQQVVSHYQQQQQRPHQLPIQQMQQYSNSQPIYQSNNLSPIQPQPNYQINNQTYTKSKIIYGQNAPQVNPSSRSPMKGPLPPPPETFLREIQRVMEKKWKVAQTLSTDLNATPNQILGFRDNAYLPPNTSAAQNSSAVVYDILPQRPVKSVRISTQVNEIPNGKHHRRMPPPPPKRNDTTRLSQRQV